MKRYANLLVLLAACLPLVAYAQTSPPTSSADFDRAMPAALEVMRQKADALKIGGCAVLAYFEGSPIAGWSSKMLVVGHMKDEPKEAQKGNNLLGIAYGKAAEMADTLKDSGSNARPVMTGEFGWQGGVIVPAGKGYLIAAFSGGKSEDDLLVSKAGAAAMQQALHLPATSLP